MAEHARYLIVPAEWASGDGFADLEEVLGAAALKTKGDGKHRAVVRVVARVDPDPIPMVVVTRFEEGDAPADAS